MLVFLPFIRSAIFANPVTINYRFYPELPSRREAADPSILTFQGEYYLFASKCGGYYHSTDLVHWDFIEAVAPLSDSIEGYAPAAVVKDGAIYFITSLDQRVYKSTNPKGNEWTLFKTDFNFTLTDPDLFVDDDGRLYYYGGCSDREPIYGCELDSTTWEPVGSVVELIYGNKEDHGWERMLDYNTDNDVAPWIEGSFMQKYGGKYYLEYANPGTSYKGYNDAVYVSTNPLGPFVLAKHNPMCYVPEGFIGAAGHGSSTVDKYGNWWHISTMAIAAREHFERRLGLFPTFFDEDGEMYAYTGFADWPMIVPSGKINGPDDVKS
jgi:beta-xylosidase